MNGYEVEWYSGKDAKTYPKRIKVEGVWRDVFKFEKEIREDFSTRKRVIIFNCDIGDNEIVRVKITGC
uniref:Uncharacterized protein n=1 Tax=candidate division WOR-3 bacterium TaxID=2052148 RepID=A0A7C4XG81_UNCW3